MKRFRFRLERVRRFRESIRDEKKLTLQRLTLELREEESRLERLLTQQRESAMPANGVLTVGIWQLTAEFRERIKKEIELQQIAILEAERKVQEALEIYLEAEKDLRSLEKLKERKHNEYQDYVAHEELKQLDEMATQKGNTLMMTEE